MNDGTVRTSRHMPKLERMVYTSPGPENTLPAKRAYEGEDRTPNKAPFSMFSRLFGPRRQSVTREDFDKTWGRLEDRKEHYKGRTERLENEVVVKDKRIKELEREVGQLQAQLSEKQGIIRSILGNLDGFFDEFRDRFAAEYDDEDDEEEEVEEADNEDEVENEAGDSQHKGGA